MDPVRRVISHSSECLSVWFISFCLWSSLFPVCYFPSFSVVSFLTRVNVFDVDDSCSHLWYGAARERGALSSWVQFKMPFGHYVEHAALLPGSISSLALLPFNAEVWCLILKLLLRLQLILWCLSLIHGRLLCHLNMDVST